MVETVTESLERAQEQACGCTDVYIFERAVERIHELEDVLKDVTAHLVAAASLLSRSPKTAAPSNKMFDQMVRDYEASAERGRKALGCQS